MTVSTYNANGQLVSRTLAAPGDATIGVSFAYDPSGQIAAETRTNNGTVVGESGYQYDAANNLTGIVHVDASGNVIDGFIYNYNANGQLTSETDFAPGGTSASSDAPASGSATSPTTNYAYDATGQLIAAGSTAYAYDANGNRTNHGYVIGRDNQILADGTWNYSYDAEGNRIGKVNPTTGLSWNYTYDDANRMTSAVETASNRSILYRVSYVYDVFGNRIEQDTSTLGQFAPTVQRFAYNGNMVWADLNGSNNITMRYLDGDAVDQLLAREDAKGNVGWYLTDHLGSVRDIVDNSGSVLDHIDYDAFGNITIETNVALGGRYKFTGREYDATTGLYYNRARYYDPSTGDWTSQDPLSFDAGDTNLYRYAVNEPQIVFDPSGLAARDGHFPADSRGEWISGSKGNGTFKYSNSVQNQRAGLAGKEFVFQNNCIGIGGFPISSYYGGNAAAATVTIEAVTGKDDSACEAAMRLKRNDPKWKKPAGYTWNHAGEPGGTTMELVETPIHSKVAHSGNASHARASASAGKAGTGMLSKGLVVVNAYAVIRDAGQQAGVLQPDYIKGEPKEYYFQESDGSVFTVYPGNWFYSPERTFVAGPRVGETETITKSDVELYKTEAEAKHGRYIPGSLLWQPRFIPGTERATLPYHEIDPATGLDYEAGYVDESGIHRFDERRIQFNRYRA